MRHLGSIERRQRLSRKQFENEYVLTSKPVILEGALVGCRALDWTLDYLKETVGDLPVCAKQSSSNIHPDLYASSETSKERVCRLSMAQYIDVAFSANDSGTHYFLSGDELQFFHAGMNNQQLAPLRADFDLPPYFDHQVLDTVGFWLSAAGVVSALHYDNNGDHNLNAQMVGSKHARLLAPDQVRHVYPFLASKDLNGGNFSRVDIRAPDLAAFPQFAAAECLEGQLNAGELLFIPALWYHSFVHTGAVNVNVNFWWRPMTYYLSSATARWILIDGVAKLVSRILNTEGPSGVEQVMTADVRQFLELLERDLVDDAQRTPAPRG